MKPSIATVSPPAGHTGGRAFVEILGAGFREPAEPPATGIAPAPSPTVRVLFGSTEALGVEVAGPDCLWVVTPIHDAGAVDVTVQNLGETPAELLTGTAPFVLGGQTLEILVGTEAQTIALTGTTAVEIAAQLNTLRGVRAFVWANRVILRSDQRGPSATLHATGGLALGLLGLPTTKATGNSTLVPIEGEETTLANGYTFVMPDLEASVPFARAVESFILELRRQVHPNVNLATSSDYDEETGDLLNTTLMASVPCIVLAQLEVQTSTGRQARGLEEVQGVGDATVLRKAPTLGDIAMTLVGVAEGPRALFALHSTVRGFFKTNGEIKTSLGEVYEIEWVNGLPAGITVQSGTSNLVTFGGTVTIRGVPIDEIPLPTATGPAWMLEGTPQDGVVGVTYPNETTTVEVVPKDLVDEV